MCHSKMSEASATMLWYLYSSHNSTNQHMKSCKSQKSFHITHIYPQSLAARQSREVLDTEMHFCVPTCKTQQYTINFMPTHIL